MLRNLAHIHLLIGWLPIVVFSITAILCIGVLVAKPRGRKSSYLRHELIVAIIAAAIGWLLIWLMSDQWLVFGVGVGWLVKCIVAVAAGALGLTITAITDSRSYRRVMACVFIPFIILSSALGIDMIYGEYTTIGSIFNLPNYEPFRRSKPASTAMTVERWKRLASRGQLPSMPEQGEVRTVAIPPTASGFKARNADVYLPPAALSSRPPALPVMVMFAGQPGSPDRFFEASTITSMMNAYAQRHHGLAPIVISPDQNGSTMQNSLCADTHVYGKAETYVTVDVTNWVIRNLPASTAPDHWLIGGFSQGGTCSTQIGPAHPEIYGHIFAADGELEPTYHNREETIRRYFNGDEAAYMKHVPTEIIKAKAPSTQTMLTTAGAWDKESQRNQEIIGRAASKAGMSVTTLISKRSGHDWHAVKSALKPEIDIFGAQTGLGANTTPLSHYDDLDIVNLGSMTTNEGK